MKAITIKQPWASLIVESGKDIENRTWPTHYRGPVLIHASKKLDDWECYAANALIEFKGITMQLEKWSDTNLPLGGIIGVAEIVDCVTSHPSPWFVGPYGFVLANVKPVRYIPCRGALGLWDAGAYYTTIE